jgi:hypothetical protein
MFSILCEIQDREIRKLDDNEIVIHIAGSVFFTQKFYNGTYSFLLLSTS